MMIMKLDLVCLIVCCKETQDIGVDRKAEKSSQKNFKVAKDTEKLFIGSINPTWHKIFFGGLDMGGAETAPPLENTLLVLLWVQMT